MNPRAHGLGSSSPEFRPYVYGASRGRASPTKATGARGKLETSQEVTDGTPPQVTVMPPAQRERSQAAERARRDAGRCPCCVAFPPNHYVGCIRVKVPNPDATRCPDCGFVAGSLGCRLTCGAMS